MTEATSVPEAINVNPDQTIDATAIAILRTRFVHATFGTYESHYRHLLQPDVPIPYAWKECSENILSLAAKGWDLEAAFYPTLMPEQKTEIQEYIARTFIGKNIRIQPLFWTDTPDSRFGALWHSVLTVRVPYISNNMAENKNNIWAVVDFLRDNYAPNQPKNRAARRDVGYKYPLSGL